MIKNQDNTQEIQKKLFSGNEAVVIETINEIRKNGKLSIISYLLDLLVTSTNEKILNKIINCISDIKDQLAAPILIDALTQGKYSSIQNYILYAMWNSNLNYTEHADSIISIIKEADFEVLIEATTVLETFAENIDNRKKEVYRSELETIANESVSPQKELLLQTVDILASTPDFSIDPIDLDS